MLINGSLRRAVSLRLVIAQRRFDLGCIQFAFGVQLMRLDRLLLVQCSLTGRGDAFVIGVAGTLD